jgi:2-amino-4-hydroxy-6-hydroxymethyldihydropteridine diphosphokinase
LQDGGSKPYSGTCLIPVCTSGSTRILSAQEGDGVHQEFHQPRLIAGSNGYVCHCDIKGSGRGGRAANGRWAVIDGVAGGRWPLAGGQWPVGGDRWGGRWPVAGGRWLVAGGRWPVAGGRWPVAGGRWPVTGGRWPVAGDKKRL